MRILQLCFFVGLLFTSVHAYGIVVEQETEGLILGTDWDYSSQDGSITILRANSDKTFVFWAHQGDPQQTLASIEQITRDLLLTSGTIKVMVSASTDGSTPGATTIGAITLDTAQITTKIEGINITGDMLASQNGTMVVDEVSGSMIFGDGTGDDLHDSMTVNSALAGAIQIAGSVAANKTITINGDVNQAISIGGNLSAGATLDINGELKQSLTVAGALAGALDVSGHSTGTITAGSIGANGSITVADDFSGGLTVTGDMAGDLDCNGLSETAFTGTVSVGGELSGSISSIGSTQGPITVGSIADGGLIHSDNSLGWSPTPQNPQTITVEGDMNGEISSGGIDIYTTTAVC